MQCDSVSVYVCGEKQIGVDDDIAGDIEGVRIPGSPTPDMAQCRVKNLVHQNKIKFRIPKTVEKVGREVDFLPICRRRLTIGIQCEIHMHQQQTVKSVPH